MSELNQEYLGDGVYAIFDGFGIELRANDHIYPSDKIYIEPSVLENLNRLDKKWREEQSESTN